MTPPINDCIEVCVCTYRRPQLRITLETLAALRAPDGFTLSVLVIDNDATPSARPLVDSIAETFPLPLRHVHCPEGNISIARNGALDHCRARYLAFIDDDEIASPDWLCALVEELRHTNADVVLGPVDAVYDETAPSWMRNLAIHSTRPVWVRGIIRAGYTCNVIIDRQAPAVRGRRFDPALGKTGGEDSLFFTEIQEAGGRIGYSERALVLEDVTPERLAYSWLLRRRLRMGQTHGRLLRRKIGTGRFLGNLAAALAKATYCFGAAVLGGYDTTRRNAALLRGALHIGVLMGLTGMRELELYGAGQPHRAKS
ncbi:succinoglycan biosynthesis protein ExoM [Roseovarius azorensis]|uniref:Succinoglycan biosynthesis protein ExoM n=1 Tax=Roseovarius azorensis TaxID=1287727 RepID=A0A1H7KL37_9RHOB|nr:glycosyltransferase family 2 protein [Roseovarius azorensis]SEK87519.1 succinoglycan biosynthesis protein ExoM [Roseovarius azorensis]